MVRWQLYTHANKLFKCGLTQQRQIFNSALVSAVADQDDWRQLLCCDFCECGLFHILKMTLLWLIPKKPAVMAANWRHFVPG